MGYRRWLPHPRTARKAGKMDDFLIIFLLTILASVVFVMVWL